jgi:hypothetical protein
LRYKVNFSPNSENTTISAVCAEVRRKERVKILRVKMCFMSQKFGLNLIVYAKHLPMLCQNAVQLGYTGF